VSVQQLQRGEDVARVDGTGKVLRSRLLENCLWIYRIEANPGMPRGGIVPPAPVLAPGSALGSRPRVALSSAQAPAVYRGPRPPGNAGAGSAAHDGSEDPTWNRGPGSGESSRTLATRRIVEAAWGWAYAVIELSCNWIYTRRRIVRDGIANI